MGLFGGGSSGPIAESATIRPLDYGHSAKQYEELKQELALLEKTSLAEEFKRLFKLTEHGLERLLERCYTVDEVKAVLESPDLIRMQNNNAQAFIKKVNSRYNLIAVSTADGEIVTVLKNVDEKSLLNLAKKYGYKLYE